LAQNRIKNNNVLVVPDYFRYKNGPIDSGRGLFSSLDIWTYILPICGPLSTFLGPFGGAQMPQNSTKTYFLVALDDFFLKNGLIDMVKGLFSSLNIGTYILPPCGPLSTFLGPFGDARMPPKQQKNLIFWLLRTTSS
jgi:hypothetical protein